MKEEETSSGSAAVDVTVLAHGRPLAGADVKGIYSIGMFRVGAVSGLTDHDGKVRLSLPPGSCSLTVRATGFAEDSWEAVSPGEMRIELEPARRITLRVTTEDGEPVANASIKAYWKPGKPPVWKVNPHAAPGIYVLDGLPHRPYRVLVSCRLLQGVRLDDVLPDETVRDVVLRKGSRISGRVVDESGKGVTNAFVSGTDEAGLYVACRADVEGCFVLQGVGDGKIALRAIGPRLLSHWVKGVTAGAENVMVQLEPGGDIEIRFGGDEIPSEADVVLQYRSEANATPTFRGWYTMTVEDRRVSLGCTEGLAWGTYDLEIFGDGFEASSVDNVVLTPEAPVNVVSILLHRVKTVT